jgi:hypothetical protein
MMSHPLMLFYLANTQIDEAQRLARKARNIATTVKAKKATRRDVVAAPVEKTEEMERVPSLV